MTSTHGDAAGLDIRDVVRWMNTHLGATLVALLAGERDSKAPDHWADPEGPLPRSGNEDRIRIAYRIWLALADAEDEDTARAWFIGTNPFLDEESPVMALREGKVHEVALAASAFLNGTWAD